MVSDRQFVTGFSKDIDAPIKHVGQQWRTSEIEDHENNVTTAEIIGLKAANYKFFKILNYANFYWHYEFQVNFDNQGIVSETSLRKK